MDGFIGILAMAYDQHPHITCSFIHPFFLQQKITPEKIPLELSASNVAKQKKHDMSHEKTLITFHYTGWFIVILIMVYCNPYIIGLYNPLYNLNNQGFFLIAHMGMKPKVEPNLVTWLNQPIPKNMIVKLDHDFPRVRGENFPKCLSCHHPEMMFLVFFGVAPQKNNTKKSPEKQQIQVMVTSTWA